MITLKFSRYGYHEVIQELAYFWETTSIGKDDDILFLISLYEGC